MLASLLRTLLFVLVACGADKSDDTGSPAETAETGEPEDTGPDPFADAVVSFEPGEGSGFGQDGYPDVVLGSPEGGGEQGGLDVLSLGREGLIELAFDDIEAVDGEGPDLLVFENPFPGWYEAGVVSASEDGETWYSWSCDPLSEGMPGCAGVGLVYATSDNGVDATDPEVAGGDAFDLADIGLARARYVSVQDAGQSAYDGEAGGFDLDAVAVVHGEPITE